MMRKHAKLIVAALVLVVGLSGASAARAAVIVSINANFLETAYDAGTQTLTVLDGADIVAEYSDGSQLTYAAGTFNLAAGLVLDASVGGVAAGGFGGGTLIISDSGGQPLLTASTLTLGLTEVVDGGGMLAGDGQFIATGGTLAPAFTDGDGEIVQITFHLNPQQISDFGQDFTALSNISLMPMPEPATLGLLITGFGWLLIRRRKA